MLKSIMKSVLDYSKNYDYFNEGVDIDYKTKLIKFTNKHEDNVCTSILLNPRVYNFKSIEVISLFKRVENCDNTDGNPLIYALKGIKYKLENKNELYKNLKDIIHKLDIDNTVILNVPTSSTLNSEILNIVNDIHKVIIQEPFIKLSGDEILMETNFNNFESSEMETFIRYCNMFGEDEFQMKKIPTKYRYLFNNIKIDNYDGSLNDKDIIIFDDTISSGTTILNTIKRLEEYYVFKSLRILTLFSPLSKGNK